MFELGAGETLASLAASLGLDVNKARSRHKIPSYIARHGVLPLFAGLGILAWSWMSPPGPELAGPMNFYIRYVLLPLFVLYAVPTQLDVGRDGVSWRWLFVRKYVAFSSVVRVSSVPPDVSIEKVHSVVIDTRNGASHRFLLGKKLGGVWIQLREAFAASTKPKEEVPVDDWLPRAKDETTLAWTRRLRAMASGDAGYRGVSVAHLWSVAEDLDAPARTRAGAVFVLASTEGARERVRVLATQVVDPAFSKLLEAVAEESVGRAARNTARGDRACSCRAAGFLVSRGGAWQRGARATLSSASTSMCTWSRCTEYSTMRKSSRRVRRTASRSSSWSS